MSDEYLRGLNEARAILESNQRESGRTVPPSLRAAHAEFLRGQLAAIDVAIASEEAKPTPDLPRELIEALFDYLGPSLQKERILQAMQGRGNAPTFKQELFAMLCRALDVDVEVGLSLFGPGRVARQDDRNAKQRKRVRPPRGREPKPRR